VEGTQFLVVGRKEGVLQVLAVVTQGYLALTVVAALAVGQMLEALRLVVAVAVEPRLSISQDSHPETPLLSQSVPAGLVAQALTMEAQEAVVLWYLNSSKEHI
jgi:hypothetical protein